MRNNKYGGCKMQLKTLCPFKLTKDQGGRRCEAEHCEWWIDGHRACVFRAIIEELQTLRLVLEDKKCMKT